MSATIHRPCLFAVTAMIVLCAAVPSSALAAIRLPATKAEMIELGRQHRTAWDLYKAFEQQANGGTKLSAADLPDWSGVIQTEDGSSQFRGFTFTSSDDGAAGKGAAQ